MPRKSFAREARFASGGCITGVTSTSRSSRQGLPADFAFRFRIEVARVSASSLNWASSCLNISRKNFEFCCGKTYLNCCETDGFAHIFQTYWLIYKSEKMLIQNHILESLMNKNQRLIFFWQFSSKFLKVEFSKHSRLSIWKWFFVIFKISFWRFTKSQNEHLWAASIFVEKQRYFSAPANRWPASQYDGFHIRTRSSLV